jgi:hypothetical protein
MKETEMMMGEKWRVMNERAEEKQEKQGTKADRNSIRTEESEKQTKKTSPNVTGPLSNQMQKGGRAGLGARDMVKRT